MSRLVLVVMNGPGQYETDNIVYVNLTRAYQFRVRHFNNPMYVLCVGCALLIQE